MLVKQIKWSDNKEAQDMILNKHYAQRKPSISYLFGLYDEDKLLGVCSFGKPASHSLCIGVCGRENAGRVYELNRLYVEPTNVKNITSWFVSRCLKQLKKDKLIIVSYSDTGMNHNGYIYQATNFLYTGTTKGRTDKYTEGNTHSRHYTNDNNHLRKVRTPKHRYVYLLDKKDIDNLKYPVLQYPKGNNKNYVIGERMKTKILNKKDGTEFYV